MKKKSTLAKIETRIRHRIYTQKIGHLSYKAAHDDLDAEKKLEAELKNNPVAKTIMERIITSGTLESFGPNTGLKKQKGSELPISGSAFRPWSGGLPGLGKKS